MACRRGLRRPWARLLAFCAFGHVATGADSKDAPWTVSCTMDCDGVNTCLERQLCEGEEGQTVMCEDNPECPGDDEPCVPVPCIWAEWSDWENDGVSGLCSRKRSFSPNKCGGDPCIGNIADTMYCDPKVITAQDCEISGWSEWGKCDPEMLQRNRERFVKKPPTHGGQPCEGSLRMTEPCGKRHPPIDCELGEWMMWSGCSHSCGGGQRMRVRAILQKALHGGRLCSGENGNPLVLQATQPCNLESCEGGVVPQDCELQDWSEWTSCSSAGMEWREWAMGLGSGERTQKYRSRRVAKPSANGGQACDTKLKETAPCKVFELGDATTASKEDCKLSMWTAWTLCDKTCDGGQTYRTREIEAPAKNGGESCKGTTMQTNPCNEHACSVNPEGTDCQLSSWTEWSRCSAQCGQGVQRRSRVIIAQAGQDGLGCNDLLESVRPCEDLEPCTVQDCAWSLWAEWSKCSRTCDGGQRSRKRSILKQPSAGGRSCEAFDSINEIEGCGTESCDPQECRDGAWDLWEPWSTCSRTCGGGVSWRHRKIALQASHCGKVAEGGSTEHQDCGQEQCETDQDCVLSEWSYWSSCSKSCDGVQARKREIRTPGKGVGKWCADEGGEPLGLKEVRSCNTPTELLAQQQAPGFSDIIEACGYGEPIDCMLSSWTLWSVCSAPCDGGQRTRNRTIVTHPSNGGQPCGGVLGQMGNCNTQPCVAAEDCQWGEWNQWSECSSCAGEKTRTREIAHAGNSIGTPCESGASKEVAQCNHCPKVKTYWCVWSDWNAGVCSQTCGAGGFQKRSRSLDKTEISPGNSSLALGKVTGEDATCSGTEIDYAACKDLPTCETGCVPQDCHFAEWSDWGDATCDGICKRNRTVAQSFNSCGRPCTGAIESTKACSKSGCDGKEACVFQQWSDWGTCTPGKGQRSRWRTVQKPAGQLGMACVGNLNETKPCEHDDEEEKADCYLDGWSAWTICSNSCGGGQQERTRQVLVRAKGGGKACDGELRVTQPCGEDPCGGDEADLSCKLGRWSDWEGCNSAEGGGQAFRTRSLTPAQGQGAPCLGVVREGGTCPKRGAVDCQLSDWAPWGDCGLTCGGGQRFRTRQVETEAKHGGEPCRGYLAESEPCNEIPCDAVDDCAVSVWSQWSTCDATCGQGQQMRERKVVQTAAAGAVGCSVGLKAVRGCVVLDLYGKEVVCHSDQDCKWSSWQEWGECQNAEFCGIGFRKRKRVITTVPTGKGKLCEPLPMEEVVSSPSCPGHCSGHECVDGEWGLWSEWGSCSVTCGEGGMQWRSRDEKVLANDCGKPLEGDREEYQKCSSLMACPPAEASEVDCLFADWGEWSPTACPAECNGARKRSRTIAQYSSHGGKACAGAVVESRRCNPGEGEEPPENCRSGAPVDCVQAEWQLWSDCSSECGLGHKTRRREVVQPPSFGGKDCENPFEEIKECNATKACLDPSRDCQWGDWEEWGQCNRRLGQKVRNRHIRQPKVGFGKACSGSRQEVGACTRKCQDQAYFCMWSEWSPFGSCTKTCGTEGRKTRRRTLKLSELPPPPPGDPEDEDKKSLYYGIQEKAEVIHSRLEQAASRRHKELAMAFTCGLLSFVAVLGLGRFLGKRLRRSGEEGEGENVRTARLAPLATANGLRAEDIELQT